MNLSCRELTPACAVGELAQSLIEDETLEIPPN